jgi:hypothetical protein
LNELAIRAHIVPGKIEFDPAEYEEHLTAQMKLYKDEPVTSANRVDRKKDVATLRKIKKAFEDRRKEVKAEWMRPYDDFEKQVQKLTGLIDEPIDLLSDQVKELESRERAEKRKQLQEHFSSVAGDDAEWLTLEQIYDQKWENASVSVKKACEEIDGRLHEIRLALMSLDMSASDVKREAMDRYKVDLNLPAALNYINQYEAQKAKIQQAEEARRREEQEKALERERQRIREEERRRVQEEEAIRRQAREETVREIKRPITDEIVKDAKVSAVYAVSAAPEALTELEMAMDSLGITWERKAI